MNRRSKVMETDYPATMEKTIRRKSKLLGAHRKSQPNAGECEGLTSVHHAALMANTNLLRKLISCGADVNAQDNKGMTPLHYAAWQSSPAVASMLLQNGAMANIRNLEGSTPLHVACQYGQNDLISLLLYYGADPCTRNWKSDASAMDYACEYGRCRAAEIILDYLQRQQGDNVLGIERKSLASLLQPSTEPPINTDSQTPAKIVGKLNRQPCSPLTLAARNGHVDVLRLLLDTASFDINRSDPGCGGNTALHEAAIHTKYETVLFLLLAGADPNCVNEAGHTPLDLLKKLKQKCDPLSQKVKQLLHEASTACYAKATRDFTADNDQELTFAYGDLILILDKSDADRWKGAVIGGTKVESRVGYFPCDAVKLVDKKVGMQRSASQRQVKKVNVPLVPDIPGMQTTSSVPSTGPYCPSSTTNQLLPILNTANNNTLITNGGSLSRRSVVYGRLGSTNQNENHVTGTLRCQGSSVTNGVNHHQTVLMTGSSQVNGNNNNSVLQSGPSPARHRNSTGSNSSQTSSGFESMKSGPGQPYVNVTVHQLRGDSPPSRNSVHSSGSSSLGSLERLDESGYGSTGHINVAEMVSNGVPDEEILAAWLHNLHYEEYLSLFVNAGYDLSTVARMTPEDLTAIGITKPGHRKRLTTEIHKLNLPDPWPGKKPATLREWLCVLNLPEYVPVFESQGFTNVDQLVQLTWEDYEDFGVKKLGHLKKLVLASKKLKDYSSSHQHQHMSNKTGSTSSSQSSGELLVINVPPSSIGLLARQNENNRTTAEVRPYSHLPVEVMSTFHQSSQSSPHHRHHDSMVYRPPDFSSSPSPTHRAYHPNGQPPINRQYHQNTFQNPSGNASFVTTDAVVHDRPKGTVKPILSGTMGRRGGGSREALEQLEKGSSSPLIQSPRHRHFQPASSLSQCYTNVSVTGSASDLSSADFQYRTRPASTAVLSNTDIMCRSAPQPNNEPSSAPQKPPIGPLAKPGAVFQLSVNPLPKLMQVIDETSSSFDELSPAPSMDEFPPPPSPILCMESIKNLRNVREHNPHLASVGTDEEALELDLRLCNTVRRRDCAGQDGEAARRTTNSTTSVESNSSTETLPFANENVGTIRQRNNNQPQSVECNATPARKPHVNEVFFNGQSSRMTSTGSPNNNAKPGDVLNDIGTMLQDLTDQLDALLLKEPNQQQQ